MVFHIIFGGLWVLITQFDYDCVQPWACNKYSISVLSNSLRGAGSKILGLGIYSPECFIKY